MATTTGTNNVDTLVGTASSDTLFGGGGDDSLFGGGDIRRQRGGRQEPDRTATTIRSCCRALARSLPTSRPSRASPCSNGLSGILISVTGQKTYVVNATSLADDIVIT